MEMRFLLSLLLVSCAFSRGRNDGSTFIQAVTDTAKMAKTWRIEGSIEDSRHVHPATFTLLMRAPTEVRYQQIGGATPAVIVCDTANLWVYSPPLNRYRTQPISQSAHCSPIAYDWESLSSTLKSPVLAGRRTIEIGGRATNCEVVRGKTEATPPASGDVRRELCIDASTNLIAWEKDEYKNEARTYTFSKIERDIDMVPDVFVLKLPPGSVPTPYEIPFPEPLGRMNMFREPGISMPRIISKLEPVYDEASRRAGIEGTVVLYVVIDSAGIPAEIEVFRHLNPGLDASATLAIKQWRFTPATKSGQPIAVGSIIEVNFKRI
jgi:TonB family protein